MLKYINEVYRRIIDYKCHDSSINTVFQEKESSKRKLKKRLNTLEVQNEMLKSVIQDELYKIFMAKLGESLEIERLRNDNKSLRKKIKTLKEIIKEDVPRKKGNKKNGQ